MSPKDKADAVDLITDAEIHINNIYSEAPETCAELMTILDKLRKLIHKP